MTSKTALLWVARANPTVANLAAAAAAMPHDADLAADLAVAVARAATPARPRVPCEFCGDHRNSCLCGY